MSELCRLIWYGLIGFFRSRASLEAEILVLRHQLNIPRRKSAKRPTFGSIDRLILAGLYGLAPKVLSALAIVRPETVNTGNRVPASRKQLQLLPILGKTFRISSMDNFLRVAGT
jgi:hypothetical protein